MNTHRARAFPKHANGNGVLTLYLAQFSNAVYFKAGTARNSRRLSSRVCRTNSYKVSILAGIVCTIGSGSVIKRGILTLRGVSLHSRVSPSETEGATGEERERERTRGGKRDRESIILQCDDVSWRKATWSSPIGTSNVRALEPQFCANSSTNPFLVLPHRTHLCSSLRLLCPPSLSLSLSAPNSLIEYPRILERGSFTCASLNARTWTAAEAHRRTHTRVELRLQQTLPVESIRMRIARPLSFVTAHGRTVELPAFDTR